jgi:hypothetical protein
MPGTGDGRHARAITKNRITFGLCEYASLPIFFVLNLSPSHAILSKY